MDGQLQRVELKELGLEKFSMSYFELDGIEYRNPHRTFDNWMVSFKDELDDDDHPSDVGPKFVWIADKEVSERHWLSCQRVIQIGHFCEVCGERTTD